MIFTLLILTGLARPMDAAGSEAGGGAGTPSTPAAASTTPQSVSTPASTPGSGSQPSSSPNGNPDTPGQQPPAVDPNINDPAYGNWKAMRDRQQALQADLQTAQSQLQQWQGLTTEATTLATKLGYDQADFEAAFKQDPIRTLQILREEANRQPGQQDPNRQDPNTIQDLIRREMEPINSVVNQQITEAAMTKYNTAVTDSLKADPILKDAPESVHSMVRDYLDEYLAAQPQIVQAMKFKGDYSAIKEATTFLAGRLHTAFTDWVNSRNGGGQQQPSFSTNRSPAPTGKRPTLDEIINDPSVLGAQYK